jgi:hypothetical protein
LPRSRLASLAAALAAVLIVTALSCKRGKISGAPEGYDFRTAHVAWKLEGSYRGTSEEYRETSGYKDGKLIYKRYAAVHNYEQDESEDRPPRKTEQRVINVNNEQYNVMRRIKRVYKFRLNLDQYLRIVKAQLWRELLTGVIPREDLSQAQRDAIKARHLDLREEDLKKVGAKITTENMMGVKVKRYDIPTRGGRATLWMYGDLLVKEDLLFDRGGKPYRKLMTPTKFELNKKIPEEVFTPPKDYKLIDTTKRIPGR